MPSMAFFYAHIYIPPPQKTALRPIKERKVPALEIAAVPVAGRLFLLKMRFFLPVWLALMHCRQGKPANRKGLMPKVIGQMRLPAAASGGRSERMSATPIRYQKNARKWAFDLTADPKTTRN